MENHNGHYSHRNNYHILDGFNTNTHNHIIDVWKKLPEQLTVPISMDTSYHKNIIYVFVILFLMMFLIYIPGMLIFIMTYILWSLYNAYIVSKVFILKEYLARSNQDGDMDGLLFSPATLAVGRGMIDQKWRVISECFVIGLVLVFCLIVPQMNFLLISMTLLNLLFLHIIDSFQKKDLPFHLKLRLAKMNGITIDKVRL